MKAIRKSLWIVILLGFVTSSVVIPNFIRARNTPASNSCINNLRRLDGATQQWALENRKLPDALVTWADIAPYLGDTPTCQKHGAYTIGPAVTNGVHCSFPSHCLPQ